MAGERMNLWQTIEGLTRRIPFTKAGVEAFLGVALRETEQSNPHFQFFDGPEVALDQGVVIAALDLRIKRKGGHSGFLVLELAGPCITLPQVRSYYHQLELTQIPRGRSLDETTVHSAMLPWGKLSFGFREKNPDCLAMVVFDPKNPE